VRILLAVFLFTVLLAPVSGFANQGRTMYNIYQTINYSLRGGSLRIACEQGLTQFRLRSGFGTRAKLFWRSADGAWVEIKDVIYGDSYISFEGMGKEGGVAVSDLNLNISLPIFNNAHSKIANDYFYKAQRSGFTEYVYVIDFVHEQMQSSNLEPIVDQLVLDKDKYVQEQVYQTPGQADAVKQSQRQSVLQKTIDRYADGLTIVTTEGKHQTQSRCYLL